MTSPPLAPSSSSSRLTARYDAEPCRQKAYWRASVTGRVSAPTVRASDGVTACHTTTSASLAPSATCTPSTGCPCARTGSRITARRTYGDYSTPWATKGSATDVCRHQCRGGPVRAGRHVAALHRKLEPVLHCANSPPPSLPSVFLSMAVSPAPNRRAGLASRLRARSRATIRARPPPTPALTRTLPLQLRSLVYIPPLTSAVPNPRSIFALTSAAVPDTECLRRSLSSGSLSPCQAAAWDFLVAPHDPRRPGPSSVFAFP
ncbi:hypothetical protein B0H15DRAFT_956416 [Mycena belliarum]|uniref:Uncharacterized protein n=1 Tax=Mycena belliarum TaxID=1033014 RepID=A0AAD6TPB8_9AGAR|nr:hypothetical protein B0H15DRAFT_956416 [Mycena belliae]